MHSTFEYQNNSKQWNYSDRLKFQKIEHSFHLLPKKQYIAIYVHIFLIYKIEGFLEKSEIIQNFISYTLHHIS